MKEMKESMAERLNRCVASFEEAADESSAIALTITPSGEGRMHVWGDVEKLAEVLKDSMRCNTRISRIVLQAVEQYTKIN